MMIVVQEHKRRGLFDAYLDGRWLCRSHAPLLSAARVLLAEGIPPENPIMMRHQGSETISLRSTVGGAAALDVESSKWGRPVFTRHKKSTGEAATVPPALMAEDAPVALAAHSGMTVVDAEAASEGCPMRSKPSPSLCPPEAARSEADHG